jgi:enoyl-CoA hydratase/carnithine racemase
VWTVTIGNPQINMLDDGTIEELHGLVSLLEQEDAPKVIIFESADPDVFIAHYDTSRAGQSSGKIGPTDYRPWLDFVLRLGGRPP